jgi:hypothetical protein
LKVNQKHQETKPMKTMMKMITPLAFLNPKIKKIVNVVEKKVTKKEKICIKIRIKTDLIKSLLKEICVNTS